jgi:hypothetical protein
MVLGKAALTLLTLLTSLTLATSFPCRYAAYIALFEPLLGASAPARPLQVDNAVKVRTA